MSLELLKGACRNAFDVASSLDKLTDRVAIGCMSTSPGEHLNLLLSLDTHRLDTVSNVFRSLPAFQLLRDEPGHLSGTLKEASEFLLQQSGRSALCHLFLVTACSTVSIPGSLDGRLRLHTISPENSVLINSPTTISGWHLSASLDNDFADASLKPTLQRVVKHLRTGIDIGVLCDLVLNLTATAGYEVTAQLGDTERKRLRPGESWTMLVKIRERRCGVECNSPVSLNSVSSESLIIKESMDTKELDIMIDQLHGMLQPINHHRRINTAATATLEYANTCFGTSTSLKTQGTCTLSRIGTQSPSDTTLRANHRHSNAGSQTLGRRYGTGGTVRVRSRPHSWRLGIGQDFNDEDDEPPPERGFTPINQFGP